MAKILIAMEQLQTLSLEYLQNSTTVGRSVCFGSTKAQNLKRKKLRCRKALNTSICKYRYNYN